MKEQLRSRVKCRQVCVQNRGQTEEKNEPGDDNPGLCMLDRCSGESQRGNPESTGELDGGPDNQSLRTVARGRADNRTGVMNGQSGPQTELGLRKIESVTQRRKNQQCDRIKHKNGPEDTAISSSSARRMGAMAAIALPPQIAVPAVIK